MNKSDVFPSKYLSAADVPEEGITITIRKVSIERMPDGAEKPIATFDERVKDMLINVTKWNTIAELYGDDSDDWIGEKITIRPGTTKYAGKTVACIDVMPKKPKSFGDKKAKPEKPPITVPEDDGDDETDDGDGSPF